MLNDAVHSVEIGGWKSIGQCRLFFDAALHRFIRSRLRHGICQSQSPHQEDMTPFPVFANQLSMSISDVLFFLHPHAVCFELKSPEMSREMLWDF